MARAKRKDKTTLDKFNEEVAAKKLNVSSRSLRRWRQAGVLPFIRTGVFIWYTDELLEKFLKQSTRNIAA